MWEGNVGWDEAGAPELLCTCTGLSWAVCPSPARVTSQLWPALNSRGVWGQLWKTPQGKCKKGAKPKRMETVKQQHLFTFFPRSPINWNCWSLHGVIKMFYTVCLTAWLYFPPCCCYLLQSIPKCWLPLNFEAEKLQIHILIWFWGVRTGPFPAVPHWVLTAPSLLCRV